MKTIRKKIRRELRDLEQAYHVENNDFNHCIYEKMVQYLIVCNPAKLEN